MCALFVYGCAQDPTVMPASGPSDPETRATGSGAADYYWYNGEKIPLTRNEKYVNVVASDGKIARSLKSAATFSAAEKSGEKRYAMPFFERGGGAEPIGTSDIFYLELKDSGDFAMLEEMAAELGVKIVQEIDYTPRWYIMSILGSDFDSSVEATNYFYETGKFANVDPAFMFDFSPNAPTDPDYSKQWGLFNSANPYVDIEMGTIWDLAYFGTGVDVAVVDQGIDFNHNEFYSPNYPHLGYDAQSGTTPSRFISGNSHGTHVAGIIAANRNNRQGMGVAFAVRLLGVSHDLYPSYTASAELARGINWAWQNGADVINCSWGDPAGAGGLLHSTALEQAIVNAMNSGRDNKGTVVVFAAGNNGRTSAVMNYPGNFHDDILTVGATDRNGRRSVFNSYEASGYGSKLDIVAPGSDIWSTMPNNSMGYMSGTSMATPHVSAVAALIIQRNWSLTRKQVVDLIEKKAQKLSNYVYSTTTGRPNGTWNYETGYGLLNAYGSFSAAVPGFDPGSISTGVSQVEIKNASYISMNNVAYASGGTGDIVYEWQVSKNWGNWEVVPNSYNTSSITLWPQVEAGTYEYRRVATQNGTTKYSNVVEIRFIDNPSAPKPATPTLRSSKSSVVFGGSDYVTATVTNYTSYAPNTVFEWRTTGHFSYISPHMVDIFAYPPSSGSYFEVQCRVAVNGRVSDWSSTLYISRQY